MLYQVNLLSCYHSGLVEAGGLVSVTFMLTMDSKITLMDFYRIGSEKLIQYTTQNVVLCVIKVANILVTTEGNRSVDLRQ